MLSKLRQALLYLLPLTRKPYSSVAIEQVRQLARLLTTPIRHLVDGYLVRWPLQLGMSELQGRHEVFLATFKPGFWSCDTESYMRRCLGVTVPAAVPIKESAQIVSEKLMRKVLRPLDVDCLARIYTIACKAIAKLLRAYNYQHRLFDGSEAHRQRPWVSLLVSILIDEMVAAYRLLEPLQVLFVLRRESYPELTFIANASIGPYKAKPISLRFCVYNVKEVMVTGIPSQVFSGSARKASLPEGFLHTLGRYLELLREAYYRSTRLIPATDFFDINGAPIMATTASGWPEGDATLLQPASNDWARCPVIPRQSTYRGAAPVRDTYLLDCVFREFPHFLSIPQKKYVANQDYYEREKKS